VTFPKPKPQEYEKIVRALTVICLVMIGRKRLYKTVGQRYYGEQFIPLLLIGVATLPMVATCVKWIPPLDDYSLAPSL
jgi:hypothetical protein